MSDPKCATLITVNVPKSGKNIVNKTVRLTINLDESNESKYPELNYKELVIAEERKKHVQNGKTAGLDPFSDNDDVERVVRKIEQKYGSKSSYARKGRPKKDDFADIGAGYDENDSFIDNTDGYDEMIPPECDTFYGGFYINSGSLEFKMVPEKLDSSKRRIESSSSEEQSSDSSSSESHDEKESKLTESRSHDTDHRKKKNKSNDKNKAKKIRRTDSSAANSGKQTSDENVPFDAESVDSRTSHSDSLTSKNPPTGSETAASDSSRDIEEVKLPPLVCDILESLESSVERLLRDQPTAPGKLLQTHGDHYLIRLESVLRQPPSEARVTRAAWTRAAKALKTSRGKLMTRIKALVDKPDRKPDDKEQAAPANPPPASSPANNKRKYEQLEDNYDALSEQQREAKIVETLQRLKDLIEERKPAMLANYNAECERVQEERKKLLLAALVDGGPTAERRLPKRRFPWCGKSRGLLSRLARLAGSTDKAAGLLASRALPLFPVGFVRMPTLLRQADLSKEIKASDIKRQRLGSASQQSQIIHNNHIPTQVNSTLSLQEPIQFPSSLTVTTSIKPSPEKNEQTEEKGKSKTIFGTVVKSFSLSSSDKSNDAKEDVYVPPNNIGSITITAVPHQTKEKKSNSVMDKHPGLIRVKSPAALNEMVGKKDMKVIKKQEKSHSKEKRLESPLHIDTSYQPTKKDPSPKDGNYSKKDPSPKTKEDLTMKQIESMRIAENNLPRPTLIPVHHSPTFAKPDKRPPEVKKKKDLVVISDVDPLSDVPVSLNLDDSSSDSVEVIETTDKSDSVVPSKDKYVKNVPKVDGTVDEEMNEDYETLMRNIREMANSQEPPKFSSSTYNSVITTAKHTSKRNKNEFLKNGLFSSRYEKDKL